MAEDNTFLAEMKQPRTLGDVSVLYEKEGNCEDRRNRVSLESIYGCITSCIGYFSVII